MFLDKRAAAWVTAYLLADGPVHEVWQRIDLESALFVVKCVTTFGSYALGEHPAAVKEILEAVHESQALEPVLFQAEVALGVKADELARAEQARVDAEAKDVQAKAELVKADAELAAAVIEEQTIVVEQQIAEQPEKLAAEIAEINERYDLKEQDLEGKIDGLAQNYFDKHPDLSNEQRDEANKTFGEIKKEEMGKLLSDRNAELEAKSREQQQQREDLEERRKELEGTRARS